MTDIEHLRKKLEEELKTLEGELLSVGRRNPKNTDDWEAVPKKWDALPADESEIADTIEEFEENTAILKQLEIRYNEVKDALMRISEGAYGLCSECGVQIERARLEANPAAITCMKHLK